MFLVDTIVEKILEPIIERLFACTWRQFGYLVHYKENIKGFADEVDKLRREKGKVDKRIEDAKDEARVEVEDDVSRWLTEAERSLTAMEEDLNGLLQGTVNLNCLDVCSRYRLGKKAEKNKCLVTELIKDGSNFVTVAHRPRLTHAWERTYSTKYERVDSRESVFEEIMAALEDDRNYKIGIHGMPGVGKTRMMQEVAQQAKNKRLFDEIAEIVVSQNPILKDIQLKLAASLNLKLDKDTTEYERKELIRIKLENGKKIIVMVDDVWNDQIKLEDIGIPATNYHTKGCKILLTSRNRDVFEAMEVPQKVKYFQIGVLSKTEAWSLFNKKVGDSIQSHGMSSVAKAVCEECAGLPLAILAVGGALKNKSKHDWEDALTQLKSSKGENIARLPAKVYSPIKMSYNYLEPDDAKSIFLLCCLFPEDAEISIDDLVRFGFGMRLLRGVDALKDARNRAHYLVTILKTSSLLLEGSEEDLVKMHDIIRDIAISIASKEKDFMFLVKDGVGKWPEEDEYKRCRAISLRLNNDCVLPNDSDIPELRTLILKGRYPSSEVSSSFFNGMVKLEVLYLEDMRIRSLPSSLKMLRLYDCELVNVAFIGELKKLEILSIEDQDLKELAPEIGQLTRLRLLDLRECDSLQIVPSGVISSLSQLEELYIPDEFDQWEVKDNASLNELNSLKRLTSLRVHVPNVELLPLNDELLFKSLIRFQISIGSKFYFWEENRSRKLKLVGFPLKKRGLNILMEKAEMLILEELKGLKDVFDNRYGEGFQELEYLEVEDCDDEMEDLLGKPKWINSQSNQLCASGGSFSKLRELKVTNCRLMKYLFSAATARSLPQLQRLCINNCEMLEEIVRDIEQEAVMDTIITFHQLKRMKLKCLPNLRSFYGNTKKKKMSTRGCNTSTLAQALFNHKVVFPALEKLEIEELGSFTAIWNDPLKSVLQELTIRDCEMLEEIISDDQEVMMNTVSFHQLKKINLYRLPNLRSFYVNLKRTSTTRCNTSTLMQALFNHKMEEIVAVERGELGEEDVVHDDDIIVFPQLKHLELRKLPNLTSFCCCNRGSIKQEEETMEHKNISRVEALFNHKIRFPAMEELNIYDLKSLTAIWDNELFSSSKGEDPFHRLRSITVEKCHKLNHIWITDSGGLLMFHNLTSLTVEKCNSLRYLFSLSIARRLTQLGYLKIEGCDAMEEIVVKNEEQGEEEDSTNEIVFPKLRRLVLGSLPKLTSFCGANNAAFKFPSLHLVCLFKCPELQTFASGGISTPPHITLYGDDWRQSHVSELNKYVEEQYIGEGKGVQTVDNEDEGTSS